MITWCNCNALRQATRRVTQLYDHLLAPMGIRSTQYLLMVEIEQHAPIAMIPLANIMVMDRATLGHNLRPLEAGGYITLSIGMDRRSREIRLTDEGRRKVADAKLLWERAQAIFEEEIGSAEATHLRDMLHHVAAIKFVEI